MNVESKITRKERFRVTGLMLFMTLLVVMVLSSSCHKYRTKGSKIVLDAPEVFTRERLVNRRLEEKAWLQGKLDEKFVHEYQGYRDLRIFSGMVAGFRGRYDPMGGKLTAANTQLATDNSKRQGELAQLQHRLNVLKLEKQIADFESGGAETADGDDISDDAASDTSTGSPPAANGDSNNSYYSIENPFTNLPALPSPQNPAETGAKLTAIEKLRDEKAYRDAIQAMLRETVLDDTHDLDGNTLYTLKFDISVLPGPRKNKYLGKVYLRLVDNPKMSDAQYEELYQKWRDQFSRDLRSEAFNQQHLFQMNLMTRQQKIQLAFDAVTYGERQKAKGNELPGIKRLVDALSANKPDYLEKIRNSPRGGTRLKELNKTILQVVTTRYEPLRDIISIENPKAYRGAMYYYANVDKESLSYNNEIKLKLRIDGLKKIIQDYQKFEFSDAKKIELEDKIWKNERFEELVTSTDIDNQQDEIQLIILSREYTIKKLENAIREIEVQIEAKKQQSVKQAGNVLSSRYNKSAEKLGGKKKKIENSLVKMKVLIDFEIEALEDVIEVAANIRNLKKNIKKLDTKKEAVNKEIKTLEEKVKKGRDSFNKKIEELKKKLKDLEKEKCKHTVTLNSIKCQSEDLEKLKKYFHPLITNIKRQRGFRHFVKVMKGLEKRNRNKPYVYTAEPKEYAQNISDVAAVEKLRNIVLSFNSVLPQSGVEADAYMYRINRSHEILLAVKRKPLVVGYINGKKDFGWIIGPRFGISKKGKVQYRHTHAQYSVQSSIIVPGWYTDLNLKWGYTWEIGAESPQGEGGKDVTVRLPGDLSALTGSLNHFKGGRSQGQYIELNPSNPRFLLQAEKEGRILIRGRKLWRNPEVYIGSQKADNVKSLPDMGGLLATFKKVVLPPRIGSDNPKVDLTVVTSEGINRLNKAVTILTKTPPLKLEEVVVKLKSPRLIKGGDLILSATVTQLPKSLQGHMFKLRIKPKGGKVWVDIVNTGKPQIKGKEVLLTFPKLGDLGKNGEMAADLQFRLHPTHSFSSIPSTGGVEGTFIYFKQEDDSKIHIEKNNVTCRKEGNKTLIANDIVLKIAEPKLFFKARPGWDSLKKNFTLTFKVDDSSSKLKLSEEKEQFSFNAKEGTITIHDGKLVSIKNSLSTIDWIVDNVEVGNEKKFTLEVGLSNGKILTIPKTLTIRRTK